MRTNKKLTTKEKTAALAALNLPIVYKTPEGFDEADLYVDPGRIKDFAGFLLSWEGSKGFVLAPKFSIRKNTDWFAAEAAVGKDGFALGETIHNLIVQKNKDLINETTGILQPLGFAVDGLDGEWLWSLSSCYPGYSFTVKVDEEGIDFCAKEKREGCGRGVRAYRPPP